VAIVDAYSRYLLNSKVPKLLVSAEPGAILTGDVLSYARSFPKQQEVTVSGSHSIQEDSPDDIGRAVAEFVAGFRGVPLPGQ
jgi:haloalkane dehalogenase